MRSLFGHIVLRFTSDAENLATESLYYILSNSKSAQKALLNYIKTINPINDELSFSTQFRDADESIPDLVGLDDTNDHILIIESKFWAGLTDHQPITYFKRFKSSKPSILLFLVPAKRINSIWSELVNRCSKQGFKIVNTVRKPHTIYGDLNQNHVIAVTDWNSLLNVIETELDATGDYRIKSDVIQLKGLCDQMDEEAFLPLNPKEISPMIAKRNIQFTELVNNVISYGESFKSFDLANYKPSSGTNHFGRYFRIDEYRFNFKLDNKLWSEIRNNPFWLQVLGKGMTSAKEERPKVKKALSSLESDNYGIYYDNKHHIAHVPIELKLGEEKDIIVKSIVEQICKIYKLLDENYEK